MLVRLQIVAVLLLILCEPGCATHRPDIAIPVATHADIVPGNDASPVSLLIEPEDGQRPLIRALDRTQNRIFVETYILTDTRVIHALERAVAQGVSVYVMLEPHPLGMGTQPQRVADLLRAAGVAVRWTVPGFQLTHAKFMLLDDQVAVISTANLSRSAFHTNREILIFDRRAAEVRALSNVFRRDWDRGTGTLEAPNLVVAPDNARSKLSALVARARTRILVYAEEVADRAMEGLLVASARRGVKVELILAWGATPADARKLVRGGVGVRELQAPYIHAKSVSIDGREAFVGSENLSTASLDRNREVGILIRGGVLRRLDRVFAHDWARATPLR